MGRDAGRGGPADGFTLRLNDDSTEPLDPHTLQVGADDVLYACAKGGHRVRFLRKAYYELMRFAQSTDDGAIVLPAGGTTIALARV